MIVTDSEIDFCKVSIERKTYFRKHIFIYLHGCSADLQDPKYVPEYSNGILTENQVRTTPLPSLSQHGFHLHAPPQLDPFSMLSKIHSSYQCAFVSIWSGEAVDSVYQQVMRSLSGYTNINKKEIRNTDMQAGNLSQHEALNSNSFLDSQCKTDLRTILNTFFFLVFFFPSPTELTISSP